MSGDTVRAESLAQDLNKRFPLDTQMQSFGCLRSGRNWLWTHRIRCCPYALQPASPIELGLIPFVTDLSCLYHVYLRGEAYQRAGQAALPPSSRRFSTTAASFGTAGREPWLIWAWLAPNAPAAKTSQGADSDAARVRALAAYKDFLTLWKDADPDVPILKQAKAEYAKLQ